MTDLEKSIEKALIERKPMSCELCGEKVYYLDSGKYQCRSCNHIMLDDFGKVKAYIEEHGPSHSVAIASATGVSPDIIDVFLRKGRLEIPEGSKYYIQCQKCHCSIRYGRFCPACIKETANSIKAVCAEDEGERPKYEINVERKAKVHFFNRRWE